MATNSYVKYSFCVDWATELPSGGTPCWSPNIILLKDIECNLHLRAYEGTYYLDIVLRKREELKELDKCTVTTFIYHSSYVAPKLIACRKLSRKHWETTDSSGKLTSQISKTTLWSAKKTLWSESKREILRVIPDILNIPKVTVVCEFHSPDIHIDKKLSDHVSRPIALKSVHLHSLSRDFSTLLKDETFSDVKLICGDQTFCANRTVLAARSEVFAAMFHETRPKRSHVSLRSHAHKMAEMEAGVVHIKDTDPDVLELLLKYVYSAEMPDLCQETAHRLYEAADKYAVQCLKRACSDWMVKCQTVENCLDLLVLGDKHSDENFKEAVACFVAKHLPDLSIESWSTFKNNYPLLVISVLEKRCDDSIPGSAKRARSDTQRNSGDEKIAT